MSCSACDNNFQPVSLTCPDMLPASRTRIASTSKELEAEDAEDAVEEADEDDLEAEFESPEEEAVEPSLVHSSSLRVVGSSRSSVTRSVLTHMDLRPSVSGAMSTSW